MGNFKDLSNLLMELNRQGIYFDNSDDQTYLKVAYNPEWDKDHDLLFKYSLVSNNSLPINFSLLNKKDSNISNIFVYEWVTIVSFKEPDKREYSIHIIRDEQDCYKNLDYIVVRNN